jgi:hypothetical protein
VDDQRQRYVRTAAVDLQHLCDRWSREATQDVLRQESSLLHRLLVEDHYGKAFRMLGFPREPRITAPDLVKMLGTLPITNIVFAAAGGAPLLSGSEFGRASMFAIRGDVSQTADYQESTFGLVRFLDSASIIIDGLPISRRMIIRLVANHLGGKHIADPGEVRPGYQLAAEAEKAVITEKWNYVYHELLSTAYFVCRSEDCRRFLQHPDLVKADKQR